MGIGATVGSVIPTAGAIVRAAGDLSALMPLVQRRIPPAWGKGHADTGVDPAMASSADPHTEQTEKAAQFDMLGRGNHFVEVCLDERDGV